MAAVTVLRRSTGKSHPTQVTEDDTLLVGGLEMGSIGSGAVALYTDGNTASITIGSSGITTTVASELLVNLSIAGPDDGTGIGLGSVPSGSTTGSAPQMISVTTTQRDQLVAAAGMVVYNSTTGVLEGRNGSSWLDLMAGAGGGVSLAATLVIGQTTGGLDIQVSTGDSILGADELTLVSTTTGVVVLDSGTTGAINIGVDGSNAKTVTIGNGTGASSVVLETGTGNLDLGVNAIAHEVQIGSTTGAAGVTVNTGTGGVDIATNAVAAEVTLGNATTTSGVTINAGTGGIDIGTGTPIMSLNFGTGGTGAKTVVVGSTASSSSVTIQAGTGTFNITQAGGDAITVGATGGSGTGSTLGLASFTTAESTANLTEVAGMLIWNTSLGVVQRHNGTSWASVETVVDTFIWRVNGKPVVATGIDGAFIVPRAGTITRCTLFRRTAGSSGSIIVDVNINGTTIYTTQGNRPTALQSGGNDLIDATTDMDVTAVAQDDRIEMDIDTVEGGNPQDVTVILEIEYTPV